MPLKLNVGIAKKVGLPSYGSLGASCYVECELDSALLTSDPERFHEHIRGAFAACSQAVHEELSRQQSVICLTSIEPPDCAAPCAGEAPTPQTSHHSNGQRASARQLDYAQRLAARIRGLGVGRLEAFAQKMFGKPLAELSSLDGSVLIDALKEIKIGKIDIDDALGAAA
jgi:hypothetical protein